MKRKLLFWLGAFITAGSFVFGITQHASVEFIISWSVGVLSSTATLALAISNFYHKK